MSTYTAVGLALVVLAMVGAVVVCLTAWRVTRWIARGVRGLGRSSAPRGLGGEYERMVRGRR